MFTRRTGFSVVDWALEGKRARRGTYSYCARKRTKGGQGPENSQKQRNLTTGSQDSSGCPDQPIPSGGLRFNAFSIRVLVLECGLLHLPRPIAALLLGTL